MKLLHNQLSEVSNMLLSNYNENILGFQGVKIKNIETSENKLYIEIELERKEHICPVCRQKTNKVHDYRKQIVKDITAFGKDVLLIFRKRRYVCNCGKRFFEKNDFLSRYQRMTKRNIQHIISSASQNCSYTSIANSHNVSVTTVIRWFNKVEYSKPTHLPAALGIDEFKGNSGGEKFHCILTDLETGEVIDILKTRYKYDLYDYFKRYSREEREKVRYFVSDMYKTYADIAKVWFPKAVYIIDKYHWVRQMNFAFERVRKDIQKKFSKSHRIYFKHSRKLLLKRWKELDDEQKQQVNIMLYASADLSSAYHLKEEMYTMLDETPPEQFNKEFKEWITMAENSEIEPFVKCAQTYKNWFSPITQSYKYRYTNGFTEGCNNKIKVLKRNAYGLRNFKRFRNRILYIFTSSNAQ